MLSAGIGYSTRMQIADASREATARALASLGGHEPSAAFVMATAAWGVGELAQLVASVCRRIDCPAAVGASVDAMTVGRIEINHVPGLAVVLLAGIEAEAVMCEPLAGAEGEVAESVAARLAGEVRPEDLLVVFADSFALSPQRLLGGFEQRLPGLTLVGLGASEPAGDEPRVWLGDELGRGACAALLLRAERAPRVRVTTGARLISPTWPVTHSAGSWVLGLDGRPALEVLRGAQPPVEGRPLARDLLVSLSRGAAAPLIRGVVGVDEARGGFALPEPVPADARMAFALPDPGLAGSRLREQAASSAGQDAALALHLSCRARFASPLRTPDPEAALLADTLCDVPLLGLRGAYQLATLEPGSPAQLQTYSDVLAILAADQAPAGSGLPLWKA